MFATVTHTFAVAIFFKVDCFSNWDNIVLYLFCDILLRLGVEFAVFATVTHVLRGRIFFFQTRLFFNLGQLSTLCFLRYLASFRSSLCL